MALSFSLFAAPAIGVRIDRRTVVDIRWSTIKVSAEKHASQQETRVHLEECVSGSVTPISGNKVRCLATGYRPCTVHLIGVERSRDFHYLYQINPSCRLTLILFHEQLSPTHRSTDDLLIDDRDDW